MNIWPKISKKKRKKLRFDLDNLNHVEYLYLGLKIKLHKIQSKIIVKPRMRLKKIN